MNAILKMQLALSLFSETARHKLEAAKTSAQLEECARLLDTKQFEDLPSHEREVLATLYATRLYHITGGLLQ